LLQLKVHQPIQIILRAPHSESKPNYSQYIALFTVEQNSLSFTCHTKVHSVSLVTQNPNLQDIALP
jgi:hypothetical protein